MIPLEFVTPDLDYLLAAPVLIIFAAACLGILGEAVLPRSARFVSQVTLTVVALLAAIAVIIWRWGAKGQGLVDPWMGDFVYGTILVDGVTQVFWVILFAATLIAAILFAERRLHGGLTAFTMSAVSALDAESGDGSDVSACQTGNDSGEESLSAPTAVLVSGDDSGSVAPGEPGGADESEASPVVRSEVFPLALFSLVGMALLVATHDLLVLFIALEVMSLPLYVLAGLARHRRLASQEAALKYFLMGAAASAILLFGVGLLFGFCGSFSYNALAHGVTFYFGSDPLLLAGLGLVGVGLLFKIGAVPFHMWVPDVYQGAPTPVTAFMSVGTKVAAVAALLRLFYVGLGGMRWTWQPVLAGVAILTILVGAVIAINQTDVKRILGYSAVVHAGFLLIPVVGAFTLQTGLPNGQVGSIAAIMFYLIGYGLATLGGFAVVSLVRSGGVEDNSLKAWAGLGRRNPLIGVVMLVFMLSLAGIPLTAGFIGKFTIFTAAWRGGYWWLALAGIVGAVIAVYIYFRLVQVMFFKEPSAEVEVARPGVATWIVLGLCLLGSLGLGLVPGPLLDMLASAASFIIPGRPG